MLKKIFFILLFFNALSAEINVSYYVDTTQKLALEDMLSKQNSEYLKYAPQKMAFGFTKDVYWLKIDIENTKNRYVDKLIELDYATLDDVQVYEKVDNRYKFFQYGDRVDNTQKQKFYKIIHNTSLEPRSDKTIYIRVSTASPMILNLAFIDPVNFFDEKIVEFITLAVYYGLVIGLMIYNFFLFLGLRDRSFLVYVLFQFSFFIFQLSLNGIGNWLIWNEFQFINIFSVPWGSMFSAFFGLLFSIMFLNMQSKKLYFMTYANLLILPLPFILSYQWAMSIAIIFGSITTITVFFIGLYAYFKQKHYLAKYFLIVWSELFLRIIILNMKSAGLLPVNFFTTYASQIGATFEALLISIVLVKKYTKLQSENIQKDHEITQKTKIIYTDELTKVHNRAYYNEKIVEVIENYKKNNRTFALALFDIDNFKSFNDTYGHDVGDSVLIELATLVKNNIRDNDIFARIGGEEFVLIFPNTNLEQGYKIVEELRRKIENNLFVDNLNVKSSFGLGELKEGDTPKNIFKRIDVALYEAKNGGRNIVIKS